MPEAIRGFFGPYRFLSNFWPCRVQFEGASYPSVEHAYQAAKTLDLKARELLQSPTVSPSQAKRWSRSQRLRPDWDQLKLGIMRDLVRQKFAVEPLRSQLLATQDALLEETNTWGDTYWGVCRGRGQNHLGRILMEVRATCRPTRLQPS